MSLTRQLARLALRPLLAGTCEVLGGAAATGAVGAVTASLVQRFSDHSQRLARKLDLAIGRTWTTLEVALAGESFWERCTVKLARGEDQEFRRLLQGFLASLPDDRLPLPREQFRQKCLEELRAARKAGLLSPSPNLPQEVADDVGAFVRFEDPRLQVEAELHAVGDMARELEKAGHVHLATLLAAGGRTPLLVLLVRYFLRRAIEEDDELFRSLAWSQLENLSEQQAKGLASLESLIVAGGQRLTDMLADVQATVEETRAAVLDVQQELREQGKQNRALYDAVLDLQRRLNVQPAEVRPRDSLSIRSEQEQQLVRDVIRRYRALPEDQRRQMPALLNAIGKLEVAAGSFAEAERDFAAVATLVDDSSARAEAHHNAYRAALERRDWPAALNELKEACRLDGPRFAPFPIEKYQPQKILGAGGFGVAFLCRHRFSGGQVVVKALLDTELDRAVGQVFSEAQLLQQLNHPGIVGLKDCGYTDETRMQRPYIVMDFVEGATLEEHVKRHGPLSQRELMPLARRTAEALLAAHGKGILHRDVKPANLLVSRDADGWHVKVIDFGLALKQAALRDTARAGQTLIGSAIAGTLDYAAPEQMGKLPGVKVGPYSDVYSWGKTCCFALFQTTQPVLKHWQSIGVPLADLLGRCLSDNPAERPADFAAVLRMLQGIEMAASGPVPVLQVVETEEAAPVLTPPPRRPERPSEPARRPSRHREEEDDLPPRPPRRSGGGAGLAVGLVLCLVVVGGFVLCGGLFWVGASRSPITSMATMEDAPRMAMQGDMKAGGPPIRFKVNDPEEGRTYLADLQPRAKSPQAPLWQFGPAGALGDGRPIEVNGGWHPPKGLSIGPPAARDAPMFIDYDIPAKMGPYLLQTVVGLDDSSNFSDRPGVEFEVLGDGNVLWKSNVIRRAGQYEDCRVDLGKSKKLTVRYRSLDKQDNQRWTIPVWVDPYLIPVGKVGQGGPVPGPGS